MACGHREHVGPEAEDRGDPERPGQDRGVRGRPAHGGRDPPDHGRIEPRRVRRGELGRHDDAGPAQLRPARTQQVAEYTGPDAVQVADPLALVAVGQPLPSAFDAGHRAVPGVGGVPSLADTAPGRIEQGLVGQEQQVRVEDARFVLAAGPDGHRVPGGLHLTPGRLQRRVQPGELGGGVGAGLARHLHRRLPQMDRVPDGQARGAGDAAQDGAVRGPGAGPRLSGPARGRERLGGATRGAGGGSAGRARGRGLVEVPLGQLAHGGEHLRRLRAGGPDQDFVSLLDAEGGDAVEAPRAGRAGRRRDVLGRHRGVELAYGLHEPRRGASVQAEPGGHRDAQLERGPFTRRRGLGGRARLAGGPGQVGDLARQPSSRLGRHLVQRITEPGRDRGGDRSLHQGGLAEHQPGPPLVRHHLRRHLGGEHRAAEIHEHEHAVVGPGRLDGPRDERGVGAQRPVRQVQAAGGDDRHVRPGHFPGQLDDAVGQPGAVRDDHDSDHRAPWVPNLSRARRRGTGPPRDGPTSGRCHG